VPAVLGGFPFTSDQPRASQALEGNKQRTCVEAEKAFAHLFELDGDSISVLGFERKRFQNEHIQSALDEITRLSAINSFLLKIKRKNTPLLLIVKRRTTTVFTLRDASKGLAEELAMCGTYVAFAPKRGEPVRVRPAKCGNDADHELWRKQANLLKTT
jgi:hypothetical protein